MITRSPSLSPFSCQSFGFRYPAPLIRRKAFVLSRTADLSSRMSNAFKVADRFIDDLTVGKGIMIS